MEKQTNNRDPLGNDHPPATDWTTEVWSTKPTTAGGSLQPGMMIGNCRIESVIGHGGMGEVYLAWNETLACHRAIKLVLASRGGDPENLLRFRREVQLLARLQHPNIAAACDAGQVDSLIYLVMEYVPGENLQTRVRRTGPLPFGEVRDIAIQAAKGLEYVHAQQLVHRDIKPSNLILTPDHGLKILDLGLARLAPQWSSAPERELTSPGGGLLMGTLEYLSPEQARDPTQVDGRSDLYSLGCLLYELLVGNAPFAEVQGIYEKLRAHAECAPTPIRPLRPDVPESLIAVVDRLLAKRREDRFANAGALIKALEAISLGPCGAVRPAQSIDLPATSLRRRRVGIALVVAASTILVAVGIATWNSHPRDDGVSDASLASTAANDARGPSDLSDRELPVAIDALTLIVDSFPPKPPHSNRKVIELLAADPSPRHALPPDGAFQVRGSLSHECIWFLVWLDTEGLAKVETWPSRPTTTIAYPEDATEYITVNAADRKGIHVLLFLAVNKSTSLASGRALLEGRLVAGNSETRVLSSTLKELVAQARANSSFLGAAELEVVRPLLPDGFSAMGALLLETTE